MEPTPVEEVLDELARVNNDLVAMHRKLERRTAELDRTVERMNQMLGMTAHDLRNPIGSIRGFAQTLLLRAGDRLQPQELAVLQRIETTSDRMLGIVHDLLALSEIEHDRVRLDLEGCDLRAIVLDAVEVARLLADDKHITLNVDASHAVPVQADAAKLDQVVVNLLTNAIKYSHRDSPVQIEVDGEDEDAVLRVIDRGVGIPAEEREVIFRPFGKASSRPTEGEASTGLGLAIAHRIVDAHGGSLTFESEVSRGTTFTVSLPRSGPVDRDVPG